MSQQIELYRKLNFHKLGSPTVSSYFQCYASGVAYKLGTAYESSTYVIDGYGLGLHETYSASASNRFYGIDVNTDTGSTDLTGDTMVGGIRGRTVIGTTQTNASIYGVHGNIDVGSAKNLTSGNFAGVYGVVDFYGNCTLAGAAPRVAGIIATVWNEGTTTLNSAGGSIVGVDIIQNGTTAPTITAGVSSAIQVRGQSAWSKTLYVSTGMHCIIEAIDDTKNIRLNSRNLTATSGSHTGVQIKPRASVTGTLSVTGLEVSPGFNASVAGGELRGIVSSPVIKAGSGNITGAIHGVESSFDFGTSGTRTITGDISAFYSFLAIPSTYTYTGGHISLIRVGDVNIKGWDCFLNLDSTGTGMTTTTQLTGGTKQYLKVKIADVDYQITLDKAS